MKYSYFSDEEQEESRTCYGKGRLSSTVLWEGWGEIPLPDPIGCNANRPRNDIVQTDNFRFDKTEKQQDHLTTKPSIKSNFVQTDLRDKKE